MCTCYAFCSVYQAFIHSFIHLKHSTSSHWIPSVINQPPYKLFLTTWCIVRVGGTANGALCLPCQTFHILICRLVGCSHNPVSQVFHHLVPRVQNYRTKCMENNMDKIQIKETMWNIFQMLDKMLTWKSYTGSLPSHKNQSKYIIFSYSNHAYSLPLAT